LPRRPKTTQQPDRAEADVEAGSVVLDGADREDGPLRRCIATGESRDPDRMIRFVVGPEDRLFPDFARKLPGRGLWVTADREALQRAIAKRLFARAAKRPVCIDADLSSTVERLAEHQCLDLIGMARRAGVLATGFEKVEAVLRKGPVGVLLEAADGSSDGHAKLRRLAGDAPVVALFTAAALAGAAGRDGVVVRGLA
jgi:predicted RNA-binding protein YlxR (DUF448 family)